MKTFTVTLTLVLSPFCFAEMNNKMGHHYPSHVIAKFDKNGNGIIDKEEQSALKEHRKTKRKKRQAFRQSFDQDGDGKLSKSERKAFKEARKAKHLKRFDKDGDGVLSAQEKEASKKARKHYKKMKRQSKKRHAEHQKAQ